MKKIVVILMLCLCLSSVASAFVPLIIPAWVYAPAAAIAITTAATGIYYGMNSGSLPYVDVGGNIKRASTAIYAYMSGGSALLSTITVDARLTRAQLSDMANSKPTLYPNVKESLSHLDIGTAGDGEHLPIGGIYDNGGVNGFYKMVATGGSVLYSANNSTGGGCTGTTVNIMTGVCSGAPIYRFYSVSNGALNDWYRQTVAFASQSQINALPVVPSTPAEIATSFAGGAASGPVSSTYAAEIDKMLQDPDYVPAFTDTTTGLPWLPPADILTPAELAAHNAAGNAQQARELAAAIAQAANATAADASYLADSKAWAAQVALNADPTNPVLIADRDRLVSLAVEAKARLDESSFVAAKILAENATITAALVAVPASPAAPAAVEPVVLAPATAVPVIPARKTIDFAPFMALNGVLATTYPFNLPSSISSYFAVFKGTPVAPVFELPLGLGQSMMVDLSVFNVLATMIRYMIGILVSVGIVFYLIHFYRGIS